MKKILIFAALALITLNSCKKSVTVDKSDKTFNGPEVQMGSGMAHSFITISYEGVPKVIGIEMTNEVLSTLPDNNFSIVIPMDAKAKETTPFDHLFVTWSAHGHPLPGTSIAPHFDVRFYITTSEKRAAILAAPAPELNTFPPAGYMPVNYFPDAGGPPVGMNWTDKTFSNPVTNALILGSYNSEFTFVAPIMILDVLKSGQSISIPYAQPQYFAQHKWYPTTYNIYMDNATQKHYVTLGGFVQR